MEAHCTGSSLGALTEAHRSPVARVTAQRTKWVLLLRGVLAPKRMHSLAQEHFAYADLGESAGARFALFA